MRIWHTKPISYLSMFAKNCDGARIANNKYYLLERDAYVG